VLGALDYRLTKPNSCTFLVRFMKIACREMTHGISAFTVLSKYILEVTLLSYDMNHKYLPSEVAAMTVFLARKCMELGSEITYLTEPIWPGTLCYHTGCSERKLENIAVDFMHEKKSISGWGLKSLKKIPLFDKVLHLALISLE